MGNAVKRTNIQNDYTLGKTLGRGHFARVRKAIRNRDQKEFAIKIVKKAKLTPAELKTVEAEVGIMLQVNHINCVNLHEIYESKQAVYLVLDLLSGGELFERITKQHHFAEREAAFCVKEVALGIQYLHSKGIVHRDLKPENLLYETKEPDSALKITDFGLAKIRTHGSMMKTKCGTPEYVAPEVIRSDHYGPECDIWSLGIIMYAMLCGFHPFRADAPLTLYKLICKGKVTFPSPYWDNVSSEAKDLILKLLVVNPDNRIKVNDLLAHPWIEAKCPVPKALPDSQKKMMTLYVARRTLRKAAEEAAVKEKMKSLRSVGKPADDDDDDDGNAPVPDVSKIKSAPTAKSAGIKIVSKKRRDEIKREQQQKKLMEQQQQGQEQNDEAVTPPPPSSTPPPPPPPPAPLDDETKLPPPPPPAADADAESKKPKKLSAKPKKRVVLTEAEQQTRIALVAQMGFDRELCVIALRKMKWNPNAASEYLFCHMDAVLKEKAKLDGE